MELRQALIDTDQNKWRKFRDISVKEKLVIVAAHLTVLAEVILSIVTLARPGYWDTDDIISIAVLVNVVFCSLYVTEGVITTRPSSLLALVCSLIFLSLLLFGNYITGHHDPVKLAQLVLVLVGTVVLLVPALLLAWRFDQSKRLVTLVFGHSEASQMFGSYLLLFRDTLLLQVQAGTSLILLTTLYYLNTENIIVLSLGLPYLIIWSLFGFWSLKNKSSLRTKIFCLFSVLSMAIIIDGFVFADQHVDKIPGITFAVFLGCVAHLASVVGVLVCSVRLLKRFEWSGLVQEPR